MHEPWGLSGPDFLVRFIGVYVLAVFLVFWVRGILSGSRGLQVGRPLDDAYRTAFLAGGPRRVVDTAIAQTVLSGRMLVAREGGLTVAAGSIGRDAVEEAVLEAARETGSAGRRRIKGLRDHPQVSAVGEHLRADGLLPTGVRVVLCRVVALLPGAVWVVGVVRAVNGAELHRPIGALIVVLVVTALVSLIVWSMAAVGAGHRPTMDGRRELEAVREEYDARVADGSVLGSAQVMGVALLGFAALTDPDLRSALVGATGSDGGGGGCGGAGGGGGGCGGCGGCGG